MCSPESKTISTIQFFIPDDIPDKKLFGYEQQIFAGLGIGKTVADGQFRSVLIFGYPGTGKSTFPIFLAKHLNQVYNLRFHLAVLRCRQVLDEMIINEIPLDVLHRNLASISRKMDSVNVILCIDEIDQVDYSFNNSLMGEPTLHERAQVVIGQWVLENLRKRRKGTVVFGVSDRPHSVEPAILSSFDTIIYFEPTDSKTVEEIIRQYLNIDHYKEVASELSLFLEKHRMRPISAEIVAACKYVNENVKKNLNDLDDKEILEIFITYFCPCSANMLVKDYEREYIPLIYKSRYHTIPYWINVKDQKTLNRTENNP